MEPLRGSYTTFSRLLLLMEPLRGWLIGCCSSIIDGTPPRLDFTQFSFEIIDGTPPGLVYHLHWIAIMDETPPG